MCYVDSAAARHSQIGSGPAEFPTGLGLYQVIEKYRPVPGADTKLVLILIFKLGDGSCKSAGGFVCTT